MKNWKNGMRIVLLLLILANGSARGQDLPAPGLLDARAIAADPRLNALVRLDANRTCLGEILEKVSAQTGVSVSIPATEPLAGIPIICHVKDLSLAEFLNSLWSLVGYSRATWQITTDAEHTPHTYRFLPTPQARNLADLLKKQSDTAADNLWKLYVTISSLHPMERQAFIGPLTLAWQMDSEAPAKQWLQDGSNVIWDMVSIVQTEFSAEQQEKLQKGIGISIPLSSLTPAHQEVMRPYIGHGYTVRNGVRTEDPPMDHLNFRYDRFIGSEKYLIRNLWINVNTKGNYGGIGILGPLEIGLKQRLAENWRLPEDARTSTPETRITTAEPIPIGGSVLDRTLAFDQMLEKIAKEQNISCLAVVPDEIHNALPTDNGKTLGQLFKDLERDNGIMHKWRNGVLLCNYQRWFYGDGTLRTYSATQR